MKTIFIIYLLSSNVYSQILVSTSTDFVINQGAQVISNGGVEISSGSLTNNGFFQITRNSSYSNIGDLELKQFANVSGDGYFKIEQDWINDGNFICDQSTVELYGNLKQLITSSNNTTTLFHNLILTGIGIGDERKKELTGVNASTDITGELYLNDRELSTLSNSFYVSNPQNSAVHFDATFQDEGFVSSLSPGYLWRETNNQSTYLFPVGSSDGMRRFRPVEINSQNAIQNYFGVRLNNFNSDDDSFDRNLTDGLSKDLNPYFYHSIKGEESNASISRINIGYLGGDGVFSGIANWSQNKWVSCSNEIPNSIGNYNSLSQDNLDLYSLFHPYILSNTDRTSDVYVPNTFTPDGEEFNNVFSPVFSDQLSFSDIELLIFDRWGELIFTGLGYGCFWDGYYNFSKCQDGVYTWTLNYSKSGIKKSLIGHVNLIR
jgi:gliding motility-associated-like protein